MRDGTTESMQHFDGEIEKLIRAGIVDFETGLSYSTNTGNLRLEMADFLEERQNNAPARSKSNASSRAPACRGYLILASKPRSLQRTLFLGTGRTMHLPAHPAMQKKKKGRC